MANADTVPQALLHNLKHNQVLHERNVILTVVFHDVPWVPVAERVKVDAAGARLLAGERHYGFKDAPDIPRSAGSRANREELPSTCSRPLLPEPGDRRSRRAGPA